MYQEEAARSTGVRFCVSYHILAAFECACVCGDRRHRHTMNLEQGAICHRGANCFGGGFWYCERFAAAFDIEPLKGVVSQCIST